MNRARAITLIAALVVSACGGDGRPSVVLVSIDTLRADHVGIYGYERDTTPHIDRFFGGGTVFESATSPAPCTIPAVRQFLQGGFDRRDERANLAELLRERGYATAAIVSQHQFYRRLEDYSPGFDHFDIQEQDAVNHHEFSARTAREVGDRAIAWLDAEADHTPFFLWLHFFDPHDPYEPPAEHRVFGDTRVSDRNGDPRTDLENSPTGAASEGTFLDMPRDLFDAADWAHFEALYDGEVRFVDAQLGRVFDRLRELGLVDRSIVVLISDHGEWLGEGARWTHCLTVRDPEVHVPFLMRVEGEPLGGRSRVSDAVSTLDLLPTVAGLVAAPLPDADYHGLDLRGAPADRVVASMWSAQVAVRDRDWKLILERGKPSRLYFTARDPAERWNRLFDRADVVQRLSAQAAPFLELREIINAEKIEKTLRKIGYIQ
jgi:arylsulfatase